MPDDIRSNVIPPSVDEDPFAQRQLSEEESLALRQIQKLPGGFRCETDSRGHSSPGGMGPHELIIHAPNGTILLWDRQVTLNWRYAPGTLARFQNPAAAEAAIDRLLADALLAWGDAVPVRFAKNGGPYDFEIAMRTADDCDEAGCVLASAFFPDAGRHSLNMYPILFRQTRAEQIETMAHELGHVFGLRHFFANLEGTGWKLFNHDEQNPYTIMNYGDLCILTDRDKADLKLLYELARSGQLTDINGTPVRLVRPYHDSVGHLGAIAIAAASA